MSWWGYFAGSLLGQQGGELEWLDLTGTKATATSLPVALAKLQPDGVLLLGGLPLGDGDLHYLLQKPTMRALALNYTQVTDRGMSAVARCERLHFLDLSGTKLTAAGVRTLYALKRLEYLTLTDVKLDAGVVEALKGLTWVKQITLGQADPEMAERLRQALPRCKIVSSLDNTAPADPTAGGSRPPTRRR